MKVKIYLGLGIVGLINVVTGNPIGALLEPLVGVVGISIGEILSGTALIWLFLALYFYHRKA